MKRCPECGCDALDEADFPMPGFAFPLAGLTCRDCGRLYLDEHTIEERLQTFAERTTRPTVRCGAGAHDR